MLETQIPVQTVEKVIGLEVVDSTNNAAKQAAAAGLNAASAPKKAAFILPLFYARAFIPPATKALA